MDQGDDPAVAAELAAHQARYAEPRLVKLGERVYAAVGFDMSNIGFVVGDDGVVVFDTGWQIENGRAALAALREVTGKDGAVSCRFSHAYPDGPAPYFAFHGEARPDGMLEQWQAIKDAASDALIANGGTITHHHAVGRDHQKWYEQQRPALFGDVLADAKRRLDPHGIMNPGVVVGG